MTENLNPDVDVDENIDQEFDQEFDQDTETGTPTAEETGKRATLTEHLFEATLSYIGAPYDREEQEDGSVTLTWTTGSDDDLKTYVVTVQPDARFTTSAEVGNTVRRMNFNNEKESQNIYAAALDLLAKDNKTE